MDDDVCVFGRFCDLVSASHIPDDEPESIVPELTLQPVYIAGRTRAGQVVKDGHMLIPLKQFVDVVRTDKSRPPGHKVISSH
jgi:hypothetical protein